MLSGATSITPSIEVPCRGCGNVTKYTDRLFCAVPSSPSCGGSRSTAGGGCGTDVLPRSRLEGRATERAMVSMHPVLQAETLQQLCSTDQSHCLNMRLSSSFVDDDTRAWTQNNVSIYLPAAAVAVGQRLTMTSRYHGYFLGQFVWIVNVICYYYYSSSFFFLLLPLLFLSSIFGFSIFISN